LRQVGEITEQERLDLLEPTYGYRWDHCNHITGDDFWMQVHYKKAYLKIKPGGHIHLHVDRPPHANKTHTVLQTNERCINRVGGVDFHCALRGIYLTDASVPHESFNHGDTDRIHLVETL
jgi:hypothetical protein